MSSPARRLLGEERFHLGADGPTEYSVLDMWRWTASDLLSNTARGRVAEWIVAVALGVAEGVREEWAPYDLRTKSGITVEVKSSAYVQGWAQAKPSRPSFRIEATRAWDPVAGYEDVARRQAVVYLFALLAEEDRAQVDARDLSQWRFYALATRVLDREVPGQKSIGLSGLEALAPVPAVFGGIAAAIEAATARR
jgi:hypothetical protein